MKYTLVKDIPRETYLGARHPDTVLASNIRSLVEGFPADMQPELVDMCELSNTDEGKRARVSIVVVSEGRFWKLREAIRGCFEDLPKKDRARILGRVDAAFSKMIQ